MIGTLFRQPDFSPARIAIMKNADNDDADLFAPLPRSLFAVTRQLLAATPIGAATNFDRDGEHSAGNADGSDRHEEREEASRRYIEQRLRETAAFEQQAAGLRRRPRRGGPGVGLKAKR